MIALVVLLFATQDPGVANADFDEWKEGLPVGWTLIVGATNSGGENPSRIEKGTEGGLSLRGDSRTGKWFALSQALDLEEGETVRISFRSRALNLRRQGNQFRNHFVSLHQEDSRGKKFDRAYRTISSPDWTPGEFIATRSEHAVQSVITIFLSVSGRMEVSDFRIELLRPETSFDVLVRHMDRYYSYFDHKEIDWPEIVSRHRNAEGDFVDRITRMLAELKDGHVWIVPPGKKRIPVWRPPTKRNFDFYAVAAKLAGVKQFGRNSLVGKTKEGYGYVAIGSFAENGSVYSEISREIISLFDAPGFIVDLRGNGGGYEGSASRIAALFCDEERVYAKAAYRSGGAYDAFTNPTDRTIAPRKGKTFTKPVICLVGQACVSSGEYMALMLKSMPHVTLLGQTTRGSTGNPQPVTLPNGIRVWFSRWIGMRADGSIFEDEGIRPDITVEHAGKGDPTFDAAVDHLRKRLAD